MTGAISQDAFSTTSLESTNIMTLTPAANVISAALTLLSSLVLSGCMSGLALVTSPDIAKLEKKPDRYLVMETDVEIDGKLETIRAEWRCFLNPSFSPNAGWDMRLQRDTTGAYASQTLHSGACL